MPCSQSLAVPYSSLIAKLLRQSDTEGEFNARGLRLAMDEA
jgi:hypothetical protein